MTKRAPSASRRPHRRPNLGIVLMLLIALCLGVISACVYDFQRQPAREVMVLPMPEPTPAAPSAADAPAAEAVDPVQPPLVEQAHSSEETTVPDVPEPVEMPAASPAPHDAPVDQHFQLPPRPLRHREAHEPRAHKPGRHHHHVARAARAAVIRRVEVPDYLPPRNQWGQL